MINEETFSEWFFLKPDSNLLLLYPEIEDRNSCTQKHFEEPRPTKNFLPLESSSKLIYILAYSYF